MENLLITGGTGSFGKKMLESLISKDFINKIIIYSRDELKQYEIMNNQKNNPYFEKLRFFIGDVRDIKRLKLAMEGVDIVIHAAALKQVPSCEYNPFEAVKTNVLGGQNVIEASMECGVKKVIALSTDKACAPINLYGATKLTSDKLFIAANNYKGTRDIKFSVVRYGNVMGSRGSVIPFFISRRSSGILPITDRRMTRFNITLQQAVDFVLYALNNMWGGELFVPKIPSYKITDVAIAVAPDAEIKEIGIRPGEKLHEEMITKTDSMKTIEFNNYYVILPSFELIWNINDFRKTSNEKPGEFLEYGFSYNSFENDWFLSVEEIKELIEREL